MKTILLTSLLFWINLAAQSQQISGRVVDKDQHPIEFATVVVQNTDSIFIGSTYTDSLGLFSIPTNDKSAIILVQYLMYAPYHKTTHTLAVGDICLIENEFILSEVVIKGERPLVRVVDGKMTYDMNALLQHKVASTAYDALLELPGVSEMDEAISLAGANSVSVILNGKPTTMSGNQLISLLKNMPKERVESAEVMYSAPSKYHVRGAAINLVLSGGTTETPQLQGQVSGSYAQKYYDSYNTGLTLLYTTPKTSTDFLYGFDYTRERMDIGIDSRHLLAGETYAIDQYNQGISRTPVHHIRLGNEFSLANQNKLTLTYTGQVTAFLHAYEGSNGTFSQSSNNKRADTPIQMHHVDWGYSSGFGLDAGVGYTFYKSHTNQRYEEQMEAKEQVFDSKSKQDIHKLSLYADQEHKLPQDWSLSYGTQFSYASDRSAQTYQAPLGQDLSASNSASELDEYTYELYAGFSKRFSDKLSVEANLTGEYYKHKHEDYWSLFPAFNLTYMAHPNHLFQLAMSSEREYPNYWSMIDAVSHMNGYAEIHGNPQLKPSKSYSAQFNYIAKSKYIFTLYAFYEDDYFVQLPFQSPDKLALIYQTTNFDYKTRLGVNVVLPHQFGSVLHSRLTLNGFYDQVKSSHFHNTRFKNDKFVLYANLNNTFSLSSKPNIKAELSGSYFTPNIQGPSTLSRIYKVDAGVKCTFAQDKVEVKLKANDLFNSWTPSYLTTQYDDQNLRMRIIPDARNISLSLSWKFGSYTDKNRKQVDTSRFGH